jgi:endonuclease-3
MKSPKGAGSRRAQEKLTADRRAPRIAARLAAVFPEIRVPLAHRNPFELLIATILSAQCTDEQVNRVTPELFARYPDAAALAEAPLAEIERIVRPLGLFRAKARAIRETARQLRERHGGAVPASMEELTALRGVGRKTANVVLGHAFGIPGVIVDTHARRVARRLGLTRQERPEAIEADLMRRLPPKEWTAFSHRLILHGRTTCKARAPQCRRCPLSELCPSASLQGRVRAA